MSVDAVDDNKQHALFCIAIIIVLAPIIVISSVEYINTPVKKEECREYVSLNSYCRAWNATWDKCASKQDDYTLYFEKQREEGGNLYARIICYVLENEYPTKKWMVAAKQMNEDVFALLICLILSAILCLLTSLHYWSEWSKALRKQKEAELAAASAEPNTKEPV